VVTILLLIYCCGLYLQLWSLTILTTAQLARVNVGIKRVGFSFCPWWEEDSEKEDDWQRGPTA
jgi:hypothetical protein